MWHAEEVKDRLLTIVVTAVGSHSPNASPNDYSL